MKEFKGTKGPWIAEPDENEFGSEQIIIYQDEGIQRHICYTPEFTQNDKVAIANAKLIQAAPDLLESLQTFIRLRQLMIYDDKEMLNKGYLSEAKVINDCFNQAEAAINKALGL